MHLTGRQSPRPGLLRRIAPFAADLRDHWDLFLQFTMRNFELTLRGSHLGLIWSFLNPLLMLSLYVYVFGFIFKGRFGVIAHETRADYALGIFLGLTRVGFLADTMSAAPAIITGNPHFEKKVIFPLEILPAASVGAAFLRMVIGLALWLAGVAIFGSGPHWQWLWLLILLPPFMLMVFGIGWLFAAVGVFIQDLSQLVAFLVQVAMYASAVFFSAQRITPSIWRILRFNPLLLIIELTRNTILWQQSINFNHLAYVYACGFVVCYIGHRAFQRMRPAFADVL